MRDRILLRRGGEGVAWWVPVSVILAVLALLATSLSFPWTASAQEPTTTTSPVAAATQTPVESPAGRSDTSTPGATSSGTTTAAAQPRTSTSARPSTSTAPSASTVRPAPQATPRAFEPRALNPGIVVKVTDLAGDPATGPGGSLLVGDVVQVEGTWTAPDNAKGGDQFFIDFPSALEVEAEGFPLLGDDDAVWGECTIDLAANRVNCTLTDTVNELSDVGGTFFLYSAAVERVTAETIDFGVNGRVQAVPLPGGGGIGDGVTIGDATKSGAFTPDKQAITWTVDIPGSELAALDTDGTGVVSLEDTLSPNMELCEDRANPTLRAGRGNDMPLVPGGVTVTQADAGSPISIAIGTGTSFDPDLLYRVQYTTCTTSGAVDPAGTQYSNSVDIGGETVGAGIGQDWKPTTTPAKSGSLAAGSRYSQLNWAITVPGTMFTEANSVDIVEALSANHAVCTDGLNLSVQRQDHLPVPGATSPASTTVTDVFAITGQPAPGATSFQLGLTWTGAQPFESDKYYIVRFRTCVTGDEVPDDSVEFTNTATVNGHKVESTVKGHDFPGSKKGTFNTAPKLVNGVEQPANTTINWRLAVPGHDLENLKEPAVIRDTFSDTLAVCEAGGVLKANLNLRVTARDFQSGGPIETRDLTEDTAVTLNGNTLQFTLPFDDGGYNRQVVYDVDYTLCTASGGVDSRGTTYSNEAAWAGATLSSRVERSSGAGGTGQGVARGSFSLLKTVAPFSEEFPVDSTDFTVRVEEFAPGVDPATGTADETYTVTVKADGTPVSGFNARGAGWQIRLTEIDLPHGNGVYFEPGVFRPAEGVVLNADRTQALVTIQPKSNVEVELVNNAKFGTATVTKTVTGAATSELTGTEKFVVRADISTGVAGSGTELREFTLQDGQFYTLGDLPIGTTVTFSEVQPVNTDRITWADPVIVPETLVIGRDPAANAVSVTNKATITEGTFQISKALSGPEADNPAVPDSFQVLATWKDNGADREKLLTLPADGRPVPFGERLPGGTEVTLTEVVPANGSGLTWGVPAFSGDVTGTDSGTAVVTIGREPRAVTVSNFVDTNDGTLRLTKQISGEAAESVDDDEEFTVQARWREGTAFRTELLTITQGESTPLGVDLPVGTEVTFTEVGRPEISGVEWSGLEWGTDPSGESWLVTNPGGTATGIVSDDPTDGRLVTLTNEAQWTNGSIGFTKYLFDGEDPVHATEADLPDDAAFDVRIDGIDPALPAGLDFPAVGETITLDSGNSWSWRSEDVLPRNTVITFSEVDPAPLDGISWARPFYYVATDAGEPGDRNTATIVPGERAEVEIRNRPIPTAGVEIDKVVTGPKGGQVAGHESTSFQVTATWTDVDEEERSCVLDVTPKGGMTPTTECNAAVVDGSVQFPLNTEITFIETGAHTEVTNVHWGEVNWSVADGQADTGRIEGEPTGVVVTLTGDPVTLQLENKTSSKGLILIPIPIPLPPFGGGSTTPPGPGSPTTPGPDRPGDPSGSQRPGDPSESGQHRPDRPSGQQKPTGHNGAPGAPAPATAASGPSKNRESSLAVTGTNVAWLGGAALALLAGGTWLVLRHRRELTADQ